VLRRCKRRELNRITTDLQVGRQNAAFFASAENNVGRRLSFRGPAIPIDSRYFPVNYPINLNGIFGTRGRRLKCPAEAA